MVCSSLSSKSCNNLYARYNVPTAFDFKDILTQKMLMNSTWEKSTINEKTGEGKMAAQGKGTKKIENQNPVMPLICVLTYKFIALKNRSIYDKTVTI